MRCVVAFFLLLAPAAAAQVDSIRFGVMDHNIRVTDGKNANKESGANVNAELRFGRVSFLEVIGAPHPYAMVSVNTDGATSYGGVGLTWDFEFAPGWRFEPGFGYVVHDGEVNNPFRAGTQAAVDFSATRVLLGSRDLFRTSLALTRDLGEDWAVQGIYEHLSHGQILGEGRNQGLDELGVRIVRRFQ
jgi:lipid A 3-O-deacylase